MLKQNPRHYLVAALSFALYIIIGYHLYRHETAPLFAGYFALFTLYLLIIRQQKQMIREEVSFWLVVSVMSRAILVFSTPALSDDFYRFIWDGRLLAAGFSPYTEVPSVYMEGTQAVPGLNTELYERLNSQHRYSSYPPMCQLVFWLSVKLSPASIAGSVIAMKSILLLFEISTLALLRKLLILLKMPYGSVLTYALNPLVILEITGNLHFEGVMIFFLLLAMFLLIRGRVCSSSLSFALSVCTKLVPLLLLPLFFRLLGKKKAIFYWLIAGAVSVFLFVPLFSNDIIYGFSTSLGYYFQKFEFNASVYYLIRAFGYWIVDFNIIQFAGPALAMLATILIFSIALRRIPPETNLYLHLFQSMLWCMLIYLAFSTTVHPWYILTILAISVFTPYDFPILWTGLIFLTYAGYTEASFKENLFLVATEYVVLLAYILYETLWTRHKNHF